MKEEYRTRLRILESSYRLFMKLGYEKTPIQAIIDDVGIAKGTFYHHFKSKEEMLLALVERMTESAMEAARKAADDSLLDPREKLIQIFREATAIKMERIGLNVDFLKQFRGGFNEKLATYVAQAASRVTGELLGPLIREGNDKGIFSTPYPEQAGELIVAMNYGLKDRFIDLLIPALEGNDAALEEFMTLYRAAESAAERILGVPEGSLPLYQSELIQQTIKEQRKNDSAS